MSTVYDVDARTIYALLATRRVEIFVVGAPGHGRYRKSGTGGLAVHRKDYLSVVMDLPVYQVDAAISVTSNVLRIRSSLIVRTAVVEYLFDSGLTVRCRRCSDGTLGVNGLHTCDGCLATFDVSRFSVRRIRHAEPPDPALLEDCNDPDLED